MISIFGLGFVGITTALYFAEKKNMIVYGIDVDKKKSDKLSEKKLPFYEPKLENILKKQLNSNFFLSSNIKIDINRSKYIFICVGTPLDNSCVYGVNLSSIFNALDEILEKIDTSIFRTIVIKSSIPPTTTEQLIKPYIEDKGFVIGKDIGLCVNPEFLREGHCYDEIEKLNRVIVGCNDENTKSKMQELYDNNKDDKIYYVNYNTAEFTKYLSNSLLANLISFSNEMSIVADNLGNINIKDAFDIIKNDIRWNECEMRSYVHPIGKYGGYCLPKDVNALYNVSKKHGFNSRMLKDTIMINNELEEYFVKKIKSKVDQKCKIGILGLSFKPNSDDIRNTASYYVIKKLIENNYNNILAYDPISIDNFKEAYSELKIKYIYDYNEIIEKSDVLVILTIWDQFKNVKSISNKEVIDFTHKI